MYTLSLITRADAAERQERMAFLGVLEKRGAARLKQLMAKRLSDYYPGMKVLCIVV